MQSTFNICVTLLPQRITSRRVKKLRETDPYLARVLSAWFGANVGVNIALDRER